MTEETRSAPGQKGHQSKGMTNSCGIRVSFSKKWDIIYLNKIGTFDYCVILKHLASIFIFFIFFYGALVALDQHMFHLNSVRLRKLTVQQESAGGVKKLVGQAPFLHLFAV